MANVSISHLGHKKIGRLKVEKGRDNCVETLNVKGPQEVCLKAGRISTETLIKNINSELIKLPSSLLYIGSKKINTRYFTMGTKMTHAWAKYQPPLEQSYQSDLAYFRNDCLDRSWCVWGSAEMPCALRVLGPISWALGSTDWHLCSFLFSSWISSSLSASRLSKSRILSSFSSRILAKSSSRSLMLKICVKLCRDSPRYGRNGKLPAVLAHVTITDTDPPLNARRMMMLQKENPSLPTCLFQ